MAVSGETAKYKLPYFLGTDKPPDMAAVTQAISERVEALLAKGGDVSIAADGTITIGAEKIDAARITKALKPSGTAAAGTEALRALGATSSTATAGDDARLSDERVPKKESVTEDKLADGATGPNKIAKSVRESLGLNSSGEARRGKAVTAGATSSASAEFVTIDEVANIVLPTDGLICLTYEALVRNNGGANAIYPVAIFLNGVQLQSETGAALEAKSPLLTNLQTRVVRSKAFTSEGAANPGLEWAAATTLTQAASGYSAGQAFAIEAAAGTYAVAIKYNPGAIKLEAEKRKLRVWTKSFD